MIRCAHCGRENDDRISFCLDCGADLRGQVSAPAASPRFRLVGLQADGTPGPTFPLEAERTVAGRDEGSVRLADDAHVSPAHVAFEIDGGDLVAEDLGSTTGTWLRVAKGTPVRVDAGDALRVGGQVLAVERMPPPSEIPGAPRIWGSPDPGYLLRLVQQLDGFIPGRIWPLAPGDHAIGRESGEITFPGDGYVSGRHAHLGVGEDGHGTFEDLGSSNGSYLRLRGPTRLKPGDLLLLGTHLLRVEVG